MVLAGRADRELALRAALRAAKAKVVVDETGQRAASAVFDVGGATAARRRHPDRPALAQHPHARVTQPAHLQGQVDR
ncbi:hypothetical protein [Protofrankia sp. BMG5.30]|uniref:hypothetical protein n=1 Tax=Protofrankia sp. BMG5.30 TaxID=1834514 RepID=UPI0009761965|nr:hypothetical protein [Protofrankia sp. BMG5.30]ONH36694.1 hypothetical protein BL254_05370 [Protofrankia sp. BMG5.30]